MNLIKKWKEFRAIKKAEKDGYDVSLEKIRYILKYGKKTKFKS